MNNLSTTPLERFKMYLKERLDDPGFANDYLLSGLSKKANLDNRLTPMLFKQLFWVRRPDEEERAFDAALSTLFNDVSHNILCVQSTGGSGKSTFINTISIRTPNVLPCYYEPIDFEFAKSPETNPAGEDALFRIFRKRYRKLCSLNQDDEWRKNFSFILSKLADKIKENSDEDDYEDLLEAINIVTRPNGEEDIRAWFVGHSQRAHNIEYVNFRIILFMLLIILLTMPSETEQRIVIVFDNIEVFASPQAKLIASVISSIHEYEKSLFSLMNMKKEFFTRFCFVFSIRTATSLSFQSNLSIQSADLWGASGKYIISLMDYDFCLEACLKKIKFLYDCFGSSVLSTPLYKRIHSVISTIIPPSKIDKYVECSELEEVEIRDFARIKLMPFFNNNYRIVIANLCEFANTTNPYYSRIREIEHCITSGQCDYNQATNGIRMILFRNIFDALKRKDVLSAFGFPDLLNTTGSKISRTLINFLYWKEVEHHYLSPKELFKGVSIYEVVRMLSHYCTNDSTIMAKTIHDLSLLTGDDFNKVFLINEWAYLIEITGIDPAAPVGYLQNVIDCCKEGNSDNEQGPACMIKLSHAGMSFANWWSKHFEFFLSRCPGSKKPLFTYTSHEIEDAIKACDDVYSVIKNGITRLVDECSLQCYFIGNRKSTYCTLKNCEDNDRDSSLLACSLFERYQELLQITTESINYIDRFRQYMIQLVSKNAAFDTLDAITRMTVTKIDNYLLDELSKFNSLYYVLYDTVKGKFANTYQLAQFNDFISRMKSLTSDINTSISSFAARSNLYYFDDDKKFEIAISNAKSTHSKESLFEINRRITAKPPCETN